MILITGSSGFIGSNFVNFFIKNKIKFHGLDKKESHYLNFNNFSKINLTDKKKLEGLFKKIKPSIIIHLASDSGLNYCHINNESAFSNNLISTFNLLIMCKKYKCKKFFFASSMAVENFNESLSFYGFTKFASENLIKSFKKNYQVKGIIARFSNIFGPFSSHKTSAIHTMIKCKLFNQKFYIHGTGNQQRDFLYVDDLIVKIIKILKLRSPKLNYLIRSGKKRSINNIINIINTNSKIKMKTKKISPPAGYDVSFSKRMNYNYSKYFHLKIKETIKWYNQKTI